MSKHNMSMLPDIGEMVATHLLGQMTIVRWGTRDARYGRELKGQAYFEHGTPIIDMSLDIRPGEALHVLLHEIGHLKAHPHELADHAKAGQTVADLERRGKIEHTHPTHHKRRESEAERWAKHWEAWANKHCPDGDIEDKLLALTAWSGRHVTREGRRAKLALAYGDWSKRYHDLTTEYRVAKAVNKLLGMDAPIMADVDVRLYEATMREMGH